MRIFASTTFLGTSATPVTEPLRLLALHAPEIDGVELGSTHVWAPDIEAQVASAWIKPLIVHNYFPPAEDDLVLNIASSNPDIRDRSIRHMKHCLDVAKSLGAPLYTIHPGFLVEPSARPANAAARKFDFGFGSSVAPYEQAFALMAAALRELVAHAALRGVALAIETEGSLTARGVTLMERPDEYDRLFALIPQGLHLNINLAHTSLAAREHGFDVAAFIRRFRDRIAAAEISHNDGHGDQHRPLEPGAPVLDLLPLLPDVPLILEFRCATVDEIKASARLVRQRPEPATSYPQ